jgi:ATP phosphoribosyltransferase
MADKTLELGILPGRCRRPRELFRKAGYNIKFSSLVLSGDRRFRDRMPADPRAMARCVERVLTPGSSGHDWVLENNARVHEVCELMFRSQPPSRPLVLCVPDDSPVQSVKDLRKRIATEVVGLRKAARHGVEANVEFPGRRRS